MNKTVYDLKLHERIKVTTGLTVTRVPGGWLYERYSYNSGTYAVCFVPFIPPNTIGDL